MKDLKANTKYHYMVGGTEANGRGLLTYNRTQKPLRLSVVIPKDDGSLSFDNHLMII